ncbi:hypothetical protein KI387_038387, partial [Taxus chinensis]
IQNTYKLFNPTTRKVIINRDVQFVENEAWDGSIEKIVNVEEVIPHDDMADESIEQQ